MNHFQDQLEQKHQSIVDFFLENELGSHLPNLSQLSTLMPKDRCIILEKLLELTGGSITLYDKLLLAYVKVDRIDLANEIIETLKTQGESEFNVMAMENKLSLGLPPERSDEQRLLHLEQLLANNDDIRDIVFINLLINFIRGQKTDPEIDL